jgi:hypothetical protein
MSRTDRPDLVLHVGMQQSGAGMLQGALSRLRPQLRAHGVSYLSQSAIKRLEHSSAQLNRHSAETQFSAEFAAELRALVDHERRATSAVARTPGPVLISSDLLLGAANIGLVDVEEFRPLASAAIGQVIDALGARRVRVVLIVNRQDRLMELSYLRDVQSGRWGEFAERFPKRFTPLLDYVGLVQRITAVPHVTDVRVRPVELVGPDPRAFIDDFLDCVDLKGRLDLEVLPADLRLRHTYSRRGMKIALGMNPHLETPRDRDRLRTFILENFAAEDSHPTRVLQKSDRRKILRAHRPSNQKLFATYLPDLPSDSYDTDEATARLADVLPPPRLRRSVRARRLADRGAEVARTQTRRVRAKVRRELKRRRRTA